MCLRGSSEGLRYCDEPWVADDNPDDSEVKAMHCSDVNMEGTDTPVEDVRSSGAIDNIGLLA